MMIGTNNRQSGENCDELVIRAKTCREALGRLFELYHPRVYKFCLHRLFFREAAEDVTSETFLSIARTIRDFAGKSEEEFCYWIYAIAANQANSYIRKNLRREKLFDSATQNGQLNTSQVHQDSNEPAWPELYQAIRELKPVHQTIITLRFFEKLSHEQISQIVDMKPGTVRANLSRALNKLKGILNKSHFLSN